MMRPLMILLTCCCTDIESDFLGMEDDNEWILNGEKKIVDWTDTVFTKTVNWSIHSILAEACLAKRLDSGNEKQRALLEEGIRLSKLAEPKMKDNEGDEALRRAWLDSMFRISTGILNDIKNIYSLQPPNHDPDTNLKYSMYLAYTLSSTEVM